MSGSVRVVGREGRFQRHFEETARRALLRLIDDTLGGLSEQALRVFLARANHAELAQEDAEEGEVVEEVLYQGSDEAPRRMLISEGL